MYFFYNSTITTVTFKSFVEVYPIEENPIEVYPIEAYLIGKGVVEVSGCSLSLYVTLLGDGTGRRIGGEVQKRRLKKIYSMIIRVP